MNPQTRRLTYVVVCVVAIMGLTGPASAQYFGANKVRFDPPAFRVLTTEHFAVYY